jgi:hypothetical protein
VLKYASRIASDETSPAAVVINAGPLLAWLEQAHGLGDMRRRLTALSRQYCNLPLGKHPDTDPVLDNPDAFVEAAKVLYAFATAGDAETGDLP